MGQSRDPGIVSYSSGMWSSSVCCPYASYSMYSRLCRMNERTSVLGSLAKPKSAPKNRRSASFHSSSENSAILYFPASTCLSEFSR
ncbi:Uncharacterised protein [Enterobacter hormaechei]|nr:Uncharacterised protein [Enterobacter hormaechei]